MTLNETFCKTVTSLKFYFISLFSPLSSIYSAWKSIRGQCSFRIRSLNFLTFFSFPRHEEPKDLEPLDCSSAMPVLISGPESSTFITTHFNFERHISSFVLLNPALALWIQVSLITEYGIVSRLCRFLCLFAMLSYV